MESFISEECLRGLDVTDSAMTGLEMAEESSTSEFNEPDVVAIMHMSSSKVGHSEELACLFVRSIRGSNAQMLTMTCCINQKHLP